MPKTILIITDNLPDQINGVVTTYKNIEAHAILEGHSIVYIDPRQFRYFDCPGYNELKIAIPREMGEKIEAAGADHIHIATEGPLGLWARKYLSKRSIRYNTAYHTRFPEAIHQLVGVPQVITWSYVRWFHRHAGRVLTTTDTMVSELQDQGFGGDVIAWTRGVDRDVFTPRLGGSGTGVLVCVSRVSEEKNLEDFLGMLTPGYRKIMVGDGPMRREYEQRYPEVEFVGFRTGKDLAEYYQMADAFVFPSRWETFGIVMIEAMACGTPVAAYPAAGPLDVIDPGITGCIHEDLWRATQQAIQLDRRSVWQGSQRWSWQRAWEIFRDNLVPAQS
jgi:glycosyltransferase involved in cell wall biosynthesis